MADLFPDGNSVRGCLNSRASFNFSHPILILKMIDRKIFEDRLTFKETTITGHTAVSRLVARFNAFVNAAVATTSATTPGGGGGEGGREAASEQFDALVKELMLMRLEIDKAEAVFAALPRERDEFDAYAETIAEQTARAEAEIAALKTELLTERAVRLQREDYEVLGKLANLYPAKARTAAGQAKVAREIEGMEEEKARLVEAVALRKRQLAFVLNAVRDLKEGLEYDLRTEEEKERYVAERAAALAKRKEGGGGGGGGGGAEGGGGGGEIGEEGGEEGEEMQMD